MSALLMQFAEDESILATRLRRRSLVARCYTVGETRLGDEGAALIDGDMRDWQAWEADALSVLDWTPRGAA